MAYQCTTFLLFVCGSINKCELNAGRKHENLKSSMIQEGLVLMLVSLSQLTQGTSAGRVWGITNALKRKL